MTDALRHPSSPNDAFHDIFKLENKIQIRIAAIWNATGNKLDFQNIQAENDIIKEMLIELSDKVKEVKRRSEEMPNKSDASVISEQLRRHQEELVHLKESLRKANVKVKQEREKQYITNRLDLLEGGNSHANDSKNQTKKRIRNKEEALKESKNVIDGLKRLRTAMASEANLAQDINVELDDQGRVINSAIKDLDDMTDRFRVGKGWLSLLKRREITDRLLVSVALIFLACVCLYIVKVRLRITFFGLWP